MYRRLASPFIRLFLKLGLTPVQITFLSLIAGVLGFVLLSLGHTLLGLLFFNISYIIDCCDGAVARITHNYHRLGGYMDNLADRVVESLFGIGYAIGNRLHPLAALLGVAYAMITIIGHYSWDSLPKKGRDEAQRNSPIQNIQFLDFGRFSQFTVLTVFFVFRLELIGLIFVGSVSLLYAIARYVYIINPKGSA